MSRLGAIGLACFVGIGGINTAFAGADALTARVNTADADRFVAIFNSANGKPTAAALQKGYLRPGSHAVEIFTPRRIRSADHLAATIATNPALYRRAIDVCLPIAKKSSGELRAIYLALQGLLGNPDLPEVHVVFGANNSGGTAGPGAQVLGLEVLCRLAGTEDEMRGLLRRFYAHETVHTLQASEDMDIFRADPLLSAVMREGVADFVAWLVTGAIPDQARHAWAREREAFIWQEFRKDRNALKGRSTDDLWNGNTPLKRWVANAGNPPEGWPGELGYWLGMRICMAYFDAAEDKQEAVKTLLKTVDYAPILTKSGYAKRFQGVH